MNLSSLCGSKNTSYANDTFCTVTTPFHTIQVVTDAKRVVGLDTNHFVFACYTSSTVTFRYYSISGSTISQIDTLDITPTSVSFTNIMKLTPTSFMFIADAQLYNIKISGSTMSVASSISMPNFSTRQTEMDVFPGSTSWICLAHDTYVSTVHVASSSMTHQSQVSIADTSRAGIAAITPNDILLLSTYHNSNYYWNMTTLYCDSSHNLGIIFVHKLLAWDTNESPQVVRATESGNNRLFGFSHTKRIGVGECTWRGSVNFTEYINNERYTNGNSIRIKDNYVIHFSSYEATNGKNYPKFYITACDMNHIYPTIGHALPNLYDGSRNYWDASRLSDSRFIVLSYNTNRFQLVDINWL